MFATGYKYLELMHVIGGDFLKLAQKLETKAVLLPSVLSRKKFR